jgi:hypothetical protein
MRKKRREGIDTQILEVGYETAEDHTDRGYNTSMNFWYVGGEVLFRTETMALADDTAWLEMDVKSPVMDPVMVRIRIYWEGSSEPAEVWEAGEASVAGNSVRVDISRYAGERVYWETAYAWEQSSLITIVPKAPPTRILCGETEKTEAETIGVTTEAEMAAESTSAESRAAEDSAASAGSGVWFLGGAVLFLAAFVFARAAGKKKKEGNAGRKNSL